MISQLGAQHLAEWLADSSREPPLLVDVREPWETELCSIAGSLAMPMHEVPHRLDEFDPAGNIVVICHHGVRSMQVAMLLDHAGCENIFNLSGGIEAWACNVDPTMRRY